MRRQWVQHYLSSVRCVCDHVEIAHGDLVWGSACTVCACRGWQPETKVCACGTQWRADGPESCPDARTCPNDGCSGDARYAAPGRGHVDGCGYPVEGVTADREALLSAMTARANAERDYRAAVLEAVERSSFRAVAEVTGLSTNTIQRWKRDA